MLNPVAAFWKGVRKLSKISKIKSEDWRKWYEDVSCGFKMRITGENFYTEQGSGLIDHLHP